MDIQRKLAQILKAQEASLSQTKPERYMILHLEAQTLLLEEILSVIRNAQITSALQKPLEAISDTFIREQGVQAARETGARNASNELTATLATETAVGKPKR